MISVIAILSALSLGVFGKMRARAQQAHCTHSLRQLGMAASMYLSEHEQVFFPYLQATPEGRLWYFGFEAGGRVGAMATGTISLSPRERLKRSERP